MSGDVSEFNTSRMPDDGDQNFGWIIKRADATGLLKMLCLSNDIFGVRTHFLNGRTGPCRKKDCRGCKHGLRSRWKGYLLCIDLSNDQQLVFEFTPPAARSLNASFEKHGTLRGSRLIAQRSSNKPNGRVIVSVTAPQVLGPSACPDYSVWPILSKIWSLSPHELEGQTGFDDDDLSEWERNE
jgi:hypothetical protein